MQYLFCFLSIVTLADVDDEYKFRLQNWNTGRLYVYQLFTNLYGTVCSGVRHEKIENNDFFGNLICKNVGFGNALFIGRKPEYTKFMGVSDIPDAPHNCQPEYGISGATCESCKPDQPYSISDNCKLRNYRTDGGACLKGHSDIYIHCDPPNRAIYGIWSSWTELEEKSETDYFRQKTRECRRPAENGVIPDSQTQIPLICAGPWMELIPAGQCLTPLHENKDYNIEYDHAEIIRSNYDDYSSYYNSYLNVPDMHPTRTVSNSGRRLPRSTLGNVRESNPFCQCKLETSGQSYSTASITTTILPTNNPTTSIPTTIFRTPRKVARRVMGNEKCPEIITVKAGMFVKTEQFVNTKAVWKRGNNYLLWTNKIFPSHSGRQSGWVVVMKLPTGYFPKALSLANTNCPGSLTRVRRSNVYKYRYTFKNTNLLINLNLNERLK